MDNDLSTGNSLFQGLNMTERKTATYQSVSANDEPSAPTLGPGKNLYSLREPLKWYVLGVCAYTLASLGMTAWCMVGPSVDLGHRVLRTGHLKVDQFYSGLVLSALLAPAGIMIRKIANDLALLHPFSIASRKPITLAHLEQMTDPGIVATVTLSKYSFSSASIQLILLAAGAFIVPIGTLLVTTGSYIAPTAGQGVVGMPTATGNGMVMEITMNLMHCPGADCTLMIDFFLDMAVDNFLGSLMRQSGVLMAIENRLGPVPTSNLTYEEHVTYEGIVTYLWESGCAYTDEITYNTTFEDFNTHVYFTFPDGSSTGKDVDVNMWSDSSLRATNDANVSVPIGGSTYYALWGFIADTAGLPNASTPAIQLEGGSEHGAWLSRVKCTPSLRWEVSTCTWNNGAMTDCIAAPGANTTALDDLGLDTLSSYLSVLPWTVAVSNYWMLGAPAISTALLYDIKAPNQGHIMYRAPFLADYDRLYGLTATSIVAVATAGYFGAAEVPTVGSTPRAVYLVRTYILGMVVAVFILVPLVTVVHLFSNRIRQIPIHRATFLTIANAVRGKWWDDTLMGGCTLDPAQLRAKHGSSAVMFGVDVGNPTHVGLAPEVSPIGKDQFYSGIGESKEASSRDMIEDDG